MEVGIMGAFGSAKEIDEITVVEVGRSTNNNGQVSWPVRVRVKGTGIFIAFGARKEQAFSGEAVWHIYRDSFGKWGAIR